jgi:DNA-binding response OmpR family regulator
MKILLIDDDAMVRYAVQILLMEFGYEVSIAADGRQGMAMFRQEQPDLVITDLIMPEQEGIETIRLMKRERPAVKILAMSGGGRIANTDLLVLARHMGADETLAKPFETEDLLGCLARMAGNRTPVEPAPSSASVAAD